MTSNPSRRRFWIIVGLGAAVLLSGAVLLLRSPPHTILDPPEPNGYDALVDVGAHVLGQAPDRRTASLEQLTAFVEANREPLRRATDALKLESCVPMQLDQYSVAQTMKDAGLLRSVGRLLAANARQCALEGQRDAELTALLDLMQLSHKTSYGGVTIHYLVAAAIAEPGLTQLAALDKDLSDEQCKRAMGVLAQLDSAREPFERVVERERYVVASQSPYAHIVLSLSGNPLLEKAMISAQRASDRLATRQRLLIVRLAILRYQESTGALPSTLEQLTPDHLAMPLRDLYGFSLKYSQTGDDYVLYSVGPDGIDDGGAAFDFATGKGDVTLQPSASREPPDAPKQPGGDVK